MIDTGATATYPIQNGHGDVVGTADSVGAFTAAPPTDEFGVGTAPADRLGWLGEKERFSTGGTLGLKRMGVRLYDPSLGRFLQVDPISGGSANDYDYAFQDPINYQDLDGLAAVVLVPVAVIGAVALGAWYVYDPAAASQAFWNSWEALKGMNDRAMDSFSRAGTFLANKLPERRWGSQWGGRPPGISRQKEILARTGASGRHGPKFGRPLRDLGSALQQWAQ